MRWFEKRRTHKSLDLLREHAKMTLTAADEFQESMDLMRQEDANIQEVESAHRRVSQIEKEGDILRRKILNELIQGMLPPQDREELARLARRMDAILDWIQESSRVLMIILNWYQDIPQDIREVAFSMSRSVVKSIFNIERCLSALLDGNIRTALARADDVERLEHFIDDQYHEVRALLVTIPPNSLSASLIVLLSQFLETLEETADRCEDATDQIRVIAVSAF